jgi:hypothetical protein|mmetsp:Transcript_66597/g.104059  ORF Transcript_66597/g.104059 Transcript_66597/m.104059 type:complete len:86 (+) Transcript_66597:1512-1769(+)
MLVAAAVRGGTLDSNRVIVLPKGASRDPTTACGGDVNKDALVIIAAVDWPLDTFEEVSNGAKVASPRGKVPTDVEIDPAVLGRVV